METVIERVVEDEQTNVPLSMFVVWIDTHVGIIQPPEWDMNSPPQPLASALDEAAWLRRSDWPAKVLPEGMTPRPDGLFESPW